jgi:hypothetical protein
MVARKQQRASEQPTGSFQLLRRHLLNGRPWGVTPVEYELYLERGDNPWWRLRNGWLIDLIERGWYVKDDGSLFVADPKPLCRNHLDWWCVLGGPLVCGVCHPPAPGLEVLWL